jgi:hypothetical protein
MRIGSALLVSRSRARRPAVIAVAVAGAALGVVHSQHSAARAAAPLRSGRAPAVLTGSPLGRTTGLRLVVASAHPFVFDVDAGTSTPLRGLASVKDGVVVVAGVSERSAVVISQRLLPAGPSGPRYARNPQLYAVESGSTSSTPLGAGSLAVAPAAGGRGVWTTRIVGTADCQLRRLALDGTSSDARSIPCSWSVSPAGSLGLAVGRTRIIDPVTGRTTLRTHLGVLAAAGRRVLLAGPASDPLSHFRLELMNAATGAEQRVRWPSALRELDEPAVDPRGRYIAIGFGDPAWEMSGEQVLDVWVLDTATGALTHVPGMPAFVRLKFSSMQWTHDGRLVLLGRDSPERAFVAVWRPGQRRLGIKTVQLPEASGSDSFAVIR